MMREEMIQLLVLDRLEHRDDLGRYLHLHKVLENGFRGFRNLSDEELAAEVMALNVDVRHEAFVDEFDDHLNDYLFDSSLSAGHGLPLNFVRE